MRNEYFVADILDLNQVGGLIQSLIRPSGKNTIGLCKGNNIEEG